MNDVEIPNLKFVFSMYPALIIMATVLVSYYTNNGIV